jgi:hypothetical protein
VTVERLPIQHPHHPHCPSCERNLPTFDGAAVCVPPPSPDSNVRVIGITLTLHVRCACGMVWDMTKRQGEGR